MSSANKNIGASVRQRLKNKARELGLPFAGALQRFAIERFLFRLSRSPYRDKLVLKGAQMLTVWRGDRARPTMDVDFEGFTENSLENLVHIVRDLCTMPGQDLDGLYLDPDSVKATRIKEDAEYEGVRVTLKGKLDSAVVHLQVDVGFDDAITPGPVDVSYPSLLDLPNPDIRAYNRESLIAEKFETMVRLGEINSRMKDFFDIWSLSEQFSFQGAELCEAVKRTFGRRGTVVEQLPSILESGCVSAEEKQVQWSAFVAKSNVSCAPKRFSDVAAGISEFMGPIVNAIARVCDLSAEWQPSGPWEFSS